MKNIPLMLWEEMIRNQLTLQIITTIVQKQFQIWKLTMCIKEVRYETLEKDIA